MCGWLRRLLKLWLLECGEGCENDGECSCVKKMWWLLFSFGFGVGGLFDIF